MILHMYCLNRQYERHHHAFKRTLLRLYLLYRCCIFPRQIVLSLPEQERTKKREDESKKTKNFDECKMSRALVVDDELDICLMITKHLQNLHFETHYALTVKEAHLKLINSTYDIMFIDLNLTDGSGFDVIQYRNKLNLKTKIVVISAYDSEANKAIEAGANLFLAKPFAVKRINETLKTLNFLPN